MATVLIASAFGLVGTVLGSAIAFWAARENAERADRRALGLVARSEYRSAVVQFASAALAYQQATMTRWQARRTGSTPIDEAAPTVYRTRAGAWHALFELELSTDDRDLAQSAQTIIEKMRSVEEPDDEVEMYRRAMEVQDRLAALVRKARDDLRAS